MKLLKWQNKTERERDESDMESVWRSYRLCSIVSKSINHKKRHTWIWFESQTKEWRTVRESNWSNFSSEETEKRELIFTDDDDNASEEVMLGLDVEETWFVSRSRRRWPRTHTSGFSGGTITTSFIWLICDWLPCCASWTRSCGCDHRHRIGWCARWPPSCCDTCPNGQCAWICPAHSCSVRICLPSWIRRWVAQCGEDQKWPPATEEGENRIKQSNRL